MLRIASVIDRFNDGIGRVVSWLAFVLVLLGAYNAVARFLDRAIGSSLSSNTWLETQWYMFAAIFLFVAPRALGQDAHVRVDLLYGQLSARGKAWINLFGSLILLIPFCLFMLWAVWPSVVESWTIKEMSPDPGGLPRWPIRAVVPISFVLLMLSAFSLALRSLATLRGQVVQPTVEKSPIEEEAHL